MSKKSLSWMRSKKQKAAMTPDRQAEYINRQLIELQQIRNCAARLMAQDQKGRDFFGPGHTEDMSFRSPKDNLRDLLEAYVRVESRRKK